MKSAPVHFDLLVYGTTAPGVFAAVRAAREGLRVALIGLTSHLGGSLPSLGALETHYRGRRAPLLHEFEVAVVDHYRAHPGDNGAALRACTTGNMLTFEPKVATAILRNMVERESRIDWWRGWKLGSVARESRRVTALHLIGVTGERRSVTANVFIEATYEGDLMAAAGVRWRIGREGRDEYDEPRAGRVFTQWIPGRFPRAAVEGRLNLVPAGATTSEPLPGSTGEGDDCIQSYSYRLCVTDDPVLRVPLAGPPKDYDRAQYAPLLLSVAEKARLALPFHHRLLIYDLKEMAERDHLFHGHALPNRKRSWNATNLTAGGRGYAEADGAGRAAIAQRHLDHALGLMWFLQHDPAVPEDLRTIANAWGLAGDEFASTYRLPPQLYVREARRLVGRAVFTEHDALALTGMEAAPPHADAIGFTDFSLDSLACSTERNGDSLCDGQLFQMEVSRPGQVRFGVLLPVELDNLVVVTTVSATHVGWGTVRQTPTLMHLAESVAHAIVLAAETHVSPAEVDVGRLQRRLIERGVAIAFHNDLDSASSHPARAAAQVAAGRGFFPNYDVRPNAPLTPAVEAVWRYAMAGRWRPQETIQRVADAERGQKAGGAEVQLAGRRSRGEVLCELCDAAGHDVSRSSSV